MPLSPPLCVFVWVCVCMCVRMAVCRVDQLQSYKMKSKLISEQNIGTFSTTNVRFRVKKVFRLIYLSVCLSACHSLSSEVALEVS